MTQQRWRWWQGIFGLMLLLAGCGGSSTPTSPSVTFSLPQYKFSIRIATNWIIFDKQEDDAANSPFSMSIQRVAVSPGPLNSNLTFEVTKLSAPGIATSIAGLSHDPTLHPMTIGGLMGYVSNTNVYYITPPTSASGAPVLPAATPVPNTAGTYIHIDYEVVSPSYLYTLSTDAAAGDNATNDLNAMVQSLVITP